MFCNCTYLSLKCNIKLGRFSILFIVPENTSNNERIKSYKELKKVK